MNEICEECGEEYTDEWCKPCQIKYFKKKFKNWTSGNEKIDDYIQEMQLKINSRYDVILEWIPYNQFNEIKKIGEGDFDTVYLAIWKGGPLYYDEEKRWMIRDSDQKVALKCLHNLRNIIDELLNEVKLYTIYNNEFHILKIYGISQNPDTKDYIMVLQDDYCKNCSKKYTDANNEWCKPCQINWFKNNFTNWTSGNEKIDAFIQGMQLKINFSHDAIIEWATYSQFNDIKEIGKCDLTTMYSAIWKDGPLYYCYYEKGWKRRQDKKVTLKYLYDSQNAINEFLNEVKTHLTNYFDGDNYSVEIYGISQNPDTKGYIMILEDDYCENCGNKYTNITYKWCNPCRVNNFKNNFTTSGNEKVDDYIQEKQLKISNYDDVVFEWISYNQFSSIKEICKDNFITIYSAIWKDGPLYYDYDEKEFIRVSDKKVILKCLYNDNSQNITDDEVIKYFTSIYDIDYAYGVSQNPDTKNYIMVLQDEHCENCGEKYTNTWCKSCLINYFKNNFTNWASENGIIDNYIQETQLKIKESDDAVFEWIPYTQLNNIKKINNGDFATIYSATWKDGPLYYNNDEKKWIREPDKKVALKCSQKITIEFLINEIKAWIHDNDVAVPSNVLKIYGISQNPDTKDYVIVHHDGYCKECGKKCTDTFYNWCKPCQMNRLKKNFTNWTSGNNKIDELIQEIQLKVDTVHDIILEWIPYNQFKEIKPIGQGGFATVYSAIWKDGPLDYLKKYEYTRISDKKVALKRLHSSKNITDKFLNEVKAYSCDSFNYILKIYGISQNPETKDYIIVLRCAEGGNFNDWMNKNYKGFDWKEKLLTLFYICLGLKQIHRNQLVHHDFHTGNILFTHNDLLNEDCAHISDMGLCGEVGNTDDSKIYGVLPYVAPEVLNGKPYTQAADIYSFGMIMYFVATGRQPFANCAHDRDLAFKISYYGTRPEINYSEAPKCYIDLMKKCWDSNPDYRPNAGEIEDEIFLFKCSYDQHNEFLEHQHYEIENQFKEAEKYRKLHLSSFEGTRPSTSHPQAIYTSRLLNHLTKDILKFSDEIAFEQLLLENLDQFD